MSAGVGVVDFWALRGDFPGGALLCEMLLRTSAVQVTRISLGTGLILRSSRPPSVPW